MRKNKIIIPMLAAFMLTAAFFMPITAYANEEPDELFDDYGEHGEYEDITVSDMDETDLSELLEPSSVSAIPDDSKAFTPDGQASVVDLAYEGDGKMFYTFKTPAGNVFYLIIDRERGMDNVYFLNAVTEYDLLSLIDSENAQGNTSTSAIPTASPSTNQPNANGDGTDENPDKTDKEDDEPPAKKKSNTGMLIFLLIGIAAIGVAGYYIKVIRPKQQGNIDDEDDDPHDDDNGEEMQFEDEQDEADGDGGGEYEYTVDSDERADDEDRE